MPLYYTVMENDRKLQLKGRYWNDDGTNICIVADITKEVNWAAYIGASTVRTEEEAVQEALRHGCKLREEDARHFFPGNVLSNIDLEKLPYRH